jgi:L-ascorbate metabolism protein UlaG (beta-lactamase superfamily)
MSATICWLGTATVHIDLGGYRILTDPALDPAGSVYPVGLGLSYRSLLDPTLPEGGLGEVDLVLLSHDHHGDNLDEAGLEVLRRAKQVLTTRAGARRLRLRGVEHVQGLAPFETVSAGPLTVHATPARHAPGPLAWLPGVGPVVGFFVEGPFQKGPLYVTGDTLWFRGLRAVRQRLGRPGTALVHAGGARFSLGPLSVRFSADAADLARIVEDFEPDQVIPIHTEGWSHFAEPPQALEERLPGRLRWLPRGVRVPLEP